MRGFPGNMYLPQKQLYDLVLVTLQNIVSWGAKNIVVISGHADPKHTIAIEQACERIEREAGITLFAPMGAIFSNLVPEVTPMEDDLLKTLGKYPNDFHAGWIETSNMLAINESLVGDNYTKQPNIEMSGRDMINPTLVADKIRGYGHIGYPKQACKKYGEQLNDSTIQQTKLCVSNYLRKENYQCYLHHRLYYDR